MKKLSVPKMIEEARATGRKKNWFLEILIFLAVMVVASTVQSIPVSIATVAAIFADNSFIKDVVEGARSTLSAGDIEGYIEIITEKTTEITSSTPVLLTTLFSDALIILVIILFCKLLQKRKPETLGLRKGNIAAEYLSGAAIGILMISLCFGIAAITGTVKVSLNSNFASGIVIWILFLIGYLIQGAEEEIMCRGYLMISVTRKYSIAVAILINSLVFAALHLANPGVSVLAIVNIALFGVLMSLYMIKRGNIWGVAAMHSMWNFFQGNIFGVKVSGLSNSISPIITEPVSGMEWLNGGDFGFEGGLIVTCVLILSILGIIFLLPEKKSEMAVPETNVTIDDVPGDNET